MRNIVLYKMLIFVVISSFLTVYLQFTKQVRMPPPLKPHIAFKHKHLSALFGNKQPHISVTVAPPLQPTRRFVICLKSKNPATNMSTRDK